MAEQEPDIHNFSTSSAHRLPTISGTQALQDELKRATGIPTSLPSLDLLLGSNAATASSTGVRRGQVTEIYGPPGVGKTTFGIQLAVNALRSLDHDSKAVWISTGAALVRSRLDAINAGYDVLNSREPPSSPPEPRSVERVLEDNFVYIETHSLPRVLTLLMHPTCIFPPPTTSIIIIDDLSNLIFGSFPRLPRNKNTATITLQDKLAQRAASRRFQVIENLASALSRLAASRHLAVVILNNASTSMKAGQKALLKPALSGQAWDAAIDVRIVLYRDFCPSGQRSQLSPREKKSYRLAAVVRLARRDIHREVVPFVLEVSGLRELVFDTPGENDMTAVQAGMNQEAPTTEVLGKPVALPPPSSPSRDAFQPAPQLPFPDDAKPSKRKAIEIADSEEEEEDDVALATAKGHEEPQLPSLGDSDALNSPRDDEGEMLLDLHERSFIEEVANRTQFISEEVQRRLP